VHQYCTFSAFNYEAAKSCSAIMGMYKMSMIQPFFLPAFERRKGELPEGFQSCVAKIVLNLGDI